jgi:hypothetical protein
MLKFWFMGTFQQLGSRTDLAFPERGDWKDYDYDNQA